jgi:hypothetical protein
MRGSGQAEIEAKIQDLEARAERLLAGRNNSAIYVPPEGDGE